MFARFAVSRLLYLRGNVLEETVTLSVPSDGLVKQKLQKSYCEKRKKKNLLDVIVQLVSKVHFSVDGYRRFMSLLLLH